MKKSLQKIQPRNGYLLTLYRKDTSYRKDTLLFPPKRMIDYSNRTRLLEYYSKLKKMQIDMLFDLSRLESTLSMV